MNNDNYSEKARIELLRGYKSLQAIKATLYIALLAICLVSCSTFNDFEKTLPKKIKYSNIQFEPCAYSGSDYVCLKNSNATQLVIEFKQCQEQNKLLRELNGN